MPTGTGYNVIAVDTNTNTTTGTALTNYKIVTSTGVGTTLGDAGKAETFASAPANATLLTTGFTYVGVASSGGTSGFYAVFNGHTAGSFTPGATYYFTLDGIGASAPLTLTADTLGAGGADY